MNLLILSVDTADRQTFGPADLRAIVWPIASEVPVRLSMRCCRTLLNEPSIADHPFTFPQSLAADMGLLSSFAQNMLALAFGRTHNLEISITDAASDPSMPRRGIAVSFLSGQLSHSHNLARATWHANAPLPAAANRPPRRRLGPKPPRPRRRPKRAHPAAASREPCRPECAPTHDRSSSS